MGEKEHTDNGETINSGEEEQEVNLVGPPYEEKQKSGKEKSESRKSKKKQRLLEEAAKANQRGICYLSRIPPHMDHVKLRQILSQYGEIQRIYLAPEGDCFFVIEYFSDTNDQMAFLFSLLLL